MVPTIDILNENAGICSPAAIIMRTLNMTDGSLSKHAVGQVTAFEDAVTKYIKENYKTHFGIWNKNSKLRSERKNIETNRPPLDSIPVDAKKSDAKAPATYSSPRKEKAQK